MFSIEYDEPGMDFWGYYEYRNGDTISASEGPSHLLEEWEDEDEDDYFVISEPGPIFDTSVEDI